MGTYFKDVMIAGVGMAHTSSAFWTCFMSGMKRKETPSVFLSTSGVTAKSYTLSIDTLSTRDCFASFGFCSLTCT